MATEQNAEFAQLLAQSPFKEIPATQNFSQAELDHAQTVAALAAKGFWAAFKELWDGISAVAVRVEPTVKSSLAELAEGLNEHSVVTIYKEAQIYKFASIMPTYLPPSSPVGSGVREETVKSWVELAEGPNGWIYFRQKNDTNKDYFSDDKEVRSLFDAGLPVLLSDLIGFSKDTKGLAIMNNKSRTRLGEGVTENIRGPQRDQYIVLKLAAPDADGNVILMQDIRKPVPVIK